MLPVALHTAIKQEDFASLVGITQPRVSQLLADGVLQREGTAEQWLLSYCERLRYHAAGRDQELTMERAALARSQRVGQELKNAAAQAEYAPVELLRSILAVASAAISAHIDALPDRMRAECPDLPSRAFAAIDETIAKARTAWLRGTSDLVVRNQGLTADDGDDLGNEDGATEGCT